MESNGRVWNTLEATVSYSAWARLTPTLTHVVAYELATSGAEGDTMSFTVWAHDLYIYYQVIAHGPMECPIYVITI